MSIQAGRFDGKVALITGASTGIGAAIAERLAAEGASVAINGRRVQLLRKKVTALTARGYDILALPGDVSTRAEQAVRSTVAHFGRLDILVNNVTTAAGLTLAIPVLIVYQVFCSRVDLLVDDIDDQALELLEHTAYNGRSRRAEDVQETA